MFMGEWINEFVLKYWLEWLFGAVLAVLGIVARNLGKKLKKTEERNQAIENGVRDMLRLTILDNYEHCMQVGSISVSRKDAIDSAYRSYHALGGNGTITQIHKEIMEMPVITK